MSDLTRRSFFGRLTAAVAAVPLVRYLAPTPPPPSSCVVIPNTEIFWRNSPMYVTESCPSNTMYILSRDGVFKLKYAMPELVANNPRRLGVIENIS